MHDTPSKPSKLLPENAYRKLNPGEVYKPIVPASDGRAEVTIWSIGLGLVMVVIFTAACVYIALRAGNGIEASIPIAILAIFFGMMRKAKTTILENVMVQSVGQASGVVAAGATFVVPALYINQLAPAWWQIFIACTIGGILGVVMIIPLRKYFVRDLHGDLPFPEATAINEVLVTGESSAGGAGKILIMAFLLGAAFDFLIEGAHLWNADITTSAIPGGIGDTLAAMRIEVKIAGIAALFGLGYIIGVKYASIIAAGSVLSFVVLVPLVYVVGKDAGDFAYAGRVFNISQMSASGIFGNFIKPIGIGAIAISGMIGIIRMGKIVVGSVTLGFKGLSKKGREEGETERTQLDMSPKNVLLIQGLATLAMGIFFFVVAMTTSTDGGESYGVGDSLLFGLVGMISGFLLSFLFTPVAAQAIAIVGVNPVSGMTLITVVLAIISLILVGLSGSAGMIIALVVGTAVCTALSTSGALISDFKVGYWIGATPRNQQRWKFLGVVVAALMVAIVIPVMNEAYQFLIQDPVTGAMISNDKVLPAPQANMIAAVSQGLMSDPANQPALLYGLGGLVAILLLMAGVPMLAFALGMYLPIAINMAVLAGAVCSWIISKTGGSEKIRKARTEQGNLIASGLMAGAAIFGIMTAVLRLPGVGAPIQYMSVGADYRLEAVVDGKVVKKDGMVVGSCDDPVITDKSKCNELLKHLHYAEDDKGNVIYNQENLTQVKTALNELQQKVGVIQNQNERMQVERNLLQNQLQSLQQTTDQLSAGQMPPQTVSGASGLVQSALQLRHFAEVEALRNKDSVTHSDQLTAANAVVELAKTADHNLHPVKAHAWFGGLGRGLGFIMLFGLGLGCFLLARQGATWQLAASKDEDEEAPAEEKKA